MTFMLYSTASPVMSQPVCWATRRKPAERIVPRNCVHRMCIKTDSIKAPSTNKSPSTQGAETDFLA